MLNKNKIINLCVVDVNDGGEVYIENGFNMKDDVFEVLEYKYDSECKYEKLEECSLEDGINDLREYYNRLDDCSEEDWKLFNNIVDLFRIKVGNKKGKFYGWDIEYDSELVFVEE